MAITRAPEDADPTDPHLGRVLGGRYPLEELLGAGSMGSVYRSRQPMVDRRVAIKLIHPGKAGKGKSAETIKQRFLREARLLASVDHPGVVTLYDFGAEEDGTLYMVMEYLEGQPLGRIFRDLPPAEVVEIAAQVLEALAEAHHRGLVHRDIKPDNVMLLNDRRNDRPLAKLLDFGIAKRINDTASIKLTRQGSVFGTPWYMSPEQARARPDIDHRTDLFSVGVMLYEGLSGRVPFDGPTPRDVLLKLVNSAHQPLSAEGRWPATLCEEIDRALSKSPADRHTDARTMATALRAVDWSDRTDRHTTTLQGAPTVGGTPLPGPLPGSLPGSLPGVAPRVMRPAPLQVASSAIPPPEDNSDATDPALMDADLAPMMEPPGDPLSARTSQDMAPVLDEDGPTHLSMSPGLDSGGTQQLERDLTEPVEPASSSPKSHSPKSHSPEDRLPDLSVIDEFPDDTLAGVPGGHRRLVLALVAGLGLIGGLVWWLNQGDSTTPDPELAPVIIRMNVGAPDGGADTP